MNAVALVATLTTPQTGMRFRKVPNEVTWLEIRADLVGDILGEWLRSCSTADQGLRIPRASASARALRHGGDAVSARAMSARKVGRSWNP
jgi:hypothetical protein